MFLESLMMSGNKETMKTKHKFTWKELCQLNRKENAHVAYGERSVLNQSECQ